MTETNIVARALEKFGITPIEFEVFDSGHTVYAYFMANGVKHGSVWSVYGDKAENLGTW